MLCEWISGESLVCRVSEMTSLKHSVFSAPVLSLATNSQQSILREGRVIKKILWEQWKANRKKNQLTYIGEPVKTGFHGMSYGMFCEIEKDIKSTTLLIALHGLFLSSFSRLLLNFMQKKILIWKIFLNEK